MCSLTARFFFSNLEFFYIFWTKGKKEEERKRKGDSSVQRSAFWWKHWTGCSRNIPFTQWQQNHELKLIISINLVIHCERFTVASLTRPDLSTACTRLHNVLSQYLQSLLRDIIVRTACVCGALLSTGHDAISGHKTPPLWALFSLAPNRVLFDDDWLYRYKFPLRYQVWRKISLNKKSSIDASRGSNFV